MKSIKQKEKKGTGTPHRGALVKENDMFTCLFF